MKILFYLFLTATLILSSCNKEERLREKLSGPKIISLYQWKKQAADGSFSIVIHDTTNLAKLIFWDNESSSINNVTYLGEFAPAGWYYSNVGLGEPHKVPIGWYSDYEQNKSLTFWSEMDDKSKFRSTYAMDIKKNGTIHLETVYNTVDGVFFEVIELSDTK
jgi:hypothetical protein